MKQITAILVLAVALAGCGGAENSSNDAATGSNDAGENGLSEGPGSTAYYRAELLNIGIRDNQTDYEVWEFAQLFCSDLGRQSYEIRRLEVAQGTVPSAPSPEDMAVFRDAVIEGFASGTNGNVGRSAYEKGEIWAEALATRGGCLSSWTTIKEYAQS